MQHYLQWHLFAMFFYSHLITGIISIVGTALSFTITVSVPGPLCRSVCRSLRGELCTTWEWSTLRPCQAQWGPCPRKSVSSPGWASRRWRQPSHCIRRRTVQRIHWYVSTCRRAARLQFVVWDSTGAKLLHC